MPSAMIWFDEKENEVIKKYSKEWKISHQETVKKIIIEFEKIKGGKK